MNSNKILPLQIKINFKIKSLIKLKLFLRIRIFHTKSKYFPQQGTTAKLSRLNLLGSKAIKYFNQELNRNVGTKILNLEQNKSQLYLQHIQCMIELFGGTLWLVLTGYNIYKYKTGNKSIQSINSIPKVRNGKQLKHHKPGNRIVLQNIVPTSTNYQDVYFKSSFFRNNIQSNTFQIYEPCPTGIQYTKFQFLQDSKYKQVQVCVGYENTRFHSNALRKSRATNSYLYKKYQPIYIIGFVGSVASVGIDFNGPKYEIIAEIVGKNLWELIAAYERAKDQAVFSLFVLGTALVTYFVFKLNKKKDDG